ncbi:hypothetical protein B5F13_12045 [Drancourtella sp. An177]|nr:hypothetical protein B5F13_12045 [Drancourtella sp. An177]
MQKRKFDLPDMYLELAEGTAEWYMGTHFFEEACDLYDAEEIVKQGKKFAGNQIYFIHYPDGSVYKPFEGRENVYYERPVWDKDCFGILSVDFSEGRIDIYTYCPGNAAEILATLPLTSVKDCYNLKVEMSPWTLGRQADSEYEIIWPLKKTFPIMDNESMICRDGDVLYFSRWTEEPYYQEYVVTVDINTGKELNVEKGSLYLMPDGTLWNV